MMDYNAGWGGQTPSMSPQVKPAAEYQAPSYLQQTNNPSGAGAVSNMVKALIAGNQQYKMQHPSGGMPASAGAPMNLAPPATTASPVDPVSMTGGMNGGAPGPTPGLPPQSAFPAPMGGGGSIGPTMSGPTGPMMNNGGGQWGQQPPVGVDPMTQALFSPIPGMAAGG